MKDGQFKMSGRFTSGALSADVTGDGTMVMHPHYALSMTVRGSLGQLAFTTQSIDVDGKEYSRVGTEKWTTSAPKSEPGNASRATGAKLVGEDTLAVGKSWHIRANDASGASFDTWVRESDGYLAKYAGTTGGGTMAIEFTQYNTGAKVTAPPDSEVKPPARQVTGKVGDAERLNGLTVTVVTADLNVKSTNRFLAPKAGDRWVVVQVLYENTGTDKISYNQFDWKLTDAAGFSYDTTYTDIGPELHSGDLAAGEKARGYISYEVPQSAAGLTLKFQHDDDTAAVPLG